MTGNSRDDSQTAGSATDYSSEPFALRRHDHCPCASGQRFKACCGKPGADRPPPFGVMVLHDVMSADACADLVAVLNDQPRQWLSAGSRNSQSGDIVEQVEETRVTQQIYLEPALQQQVNTLLQTLWTDNVASSVGATIEWFEEPHILHYPVGGQFTSHADSEVYDMASGKYHRVADRDLSMLLYLNSDFEGGDLLFDLFHYRYHPTAGDLVVFPSDHRYTHHARKVTAGERLAVVSWAKVKGSPQSLESAPATAIFC